VAGPATLDYTLQPSLGGRWLAGSATSPELGLEIADRWGVDPETGDIVRTIFQSNVNYGTNISRGWEGDTLRFESGARTAGGDMSVRQTITRVTANEFTAAWQALLDGAWNPYSIERLTRRPVR
jgi:hypothetical protein